MNYPVYGNSQLYLQELQSMKDRIDNQMKQIQHQQQNQMQQPLQQPTNLTQNFQLAPTQTNNNELESKYVNSIDDVKKIFVIKTGVFVDKDYSTLWVKDVNGNIRTFKTEEVVEIDEKDKEILALKKQIEEMKGMIVSANEYNNANVDEPIAETKSTRVQASKRSSTK